MTLQELMQSVNAGGSDRPDIARFSPDELRARELKQQQDFMALIEKYPLPQASGLRIVRGVRGTKGGKKLLSKPGERKPTGKQRNPVQNIPIDKIRHGESALPGGKLEDPGAEEFIVGLMKKGKVKPIEVLPDEQGYMVYDGSHRLEAAIRRGDKSIPARIVGKDAPMRAQRKINPYLKGVKKGDEMIATHNLSEANLLEAHELGGLPVPSIGISKVKYPMDQFGDIALIPDQHMVTPSGRSNPVYSTDAYSKRFPEVDYTVDPPRIFKGFTHGGKRRYSDYTLDNLVKMMKGDPRNAEDYFYGAGSLRAEHTPPFKNFKAMQKSRDKLISNKEMAQVKRRMSDEFEEIVDALGPYDKNPSLYDNMGYMDVVGARLGRKERLSDYYDDLPRDVLDKISKFKRNLIDAPTEYFEAKPQRAVRLDEFKGAVVPEGVTDRTMEILKRFHKIGRIEKYGGNKQTKEQALKSFGDLMFSPGVGLLPINRILKLFQAKPVQESQQMPRGVDPFMWKSYGGRS